MLKASALYLVIVIALVIALLCSSLIAAAYYYRLEYQRKFRYDQMESNLQSGVNLLLTSADSTYARPTAVDLYDKGSDSVLLHKFNWGIYDIGVVKAFALQDTLFSAFSLASSVDSAKWACLYLADQDRPLSLSGETSIIGDAWVPKAGVKKAYVNGKAYQGDDHLIVGKINNSNKTLPLLDQKRLNKLHQYLAQKASATPADSILAKTDSIENSFLKPTRTIHLKGQQTLKNIRLQGNIILFSDSSLTIDASCKLENVLIFARSIQVNSGFRGACQLFAADSIHIEPDCQFLYPSCLGVVNSGLASGQVKLVLDRNTIVNGALFVVRSKEEDNMPILSLDSNVDITGQIYSQGMLKFKSNLKVNGSVFTRLFTYQSSYNLMENTLIDAQINSKKLSRYYLTSDLFPVAKRKKILQWLDQN